MSSALPTADLVIVGNGISLFRAGRGEEIDSYDSICRMKGGVTLVVSQPKDYGVGVDYICSTLKTATSFKGFPVKEYWGYENYKTPCPDVNKFKAKVRLETDATHYWLKVYEGLVKDMDVEPWYSTGMGAIVIAAASKLFTSITLMGFDNLVSGNVGRGVNVLRDKDFKYPKHAWDVENKMLGMISDHYGIPVE